MECLFCNHKCSTQDILEEHYRKHSHERPYLCPKCPKEVTSNHSLNLHLQTHRPLEERRLECHFCEKIFLAKSAFRLHLKYHGQERKFSCAICGKKFFNSVILKQHEKLHKNLIKFECKMCHKFYKTNCHLKRHEETAHEGKRHECRVCGKKFAGKDNCKRHLKTHLIKRESFQCSNCSKTFVSKPSYKEHLLIHQEQEYSYKCDKCEQRFLVQRQLKFHKKYSHLEGNIFTCVFCDKQFPQLCRLQFHLVSHTFERPYLCRQCPAEYNQSTSLRYHNKSTHCKIREKFKCEMCSKTFLSKGGLQDHIRQHTGELHYECQSPGCGMKFAYAAIRREHYLRTHVGKELSCNICENKFSTKAGLKRHGLVHSDLRAYHCYKCGLSYKQKSDLRKHIFTAHAV